MPVTHPDEASRLLAAGAAACAVLVGVASAGGVWLPSTYAHETASWAAQGTGQDFVNLLVVVPWLLVGAVGVARGWSAAKPLLGGALVYVAYSYALYAFAVHFNALFLVYCAALGLSFWMLARLCLDAARAPDRDAPAPGPARLAGGVLVAQGLAFYLLWLAEDVPALVAGRPPATLAEVGLVTNPVHVIDLALALPAMIGAGVGVLRRRPAAAWAAMVMLSFGLLMATAIGGMIVVMRARGLPRAMAPAAAMAVVAVASAVALGRLCLAAPEAPAARSSA
jgi:hypothetical protein